MYLTERDALEIKIPMLPHIYDEPFSDSSQLPTYLVSKAAKPVSVALTGDAADELFGGYNRYLLASNIFSKLSYIPYSCRSFVASSIKVI